MREFPGKIGPFRELAENCNSQWRAVICYIVGNPDESTRASLTWSPDLVEMQVHSLNAATIYLQVWTRQLRQAGGNPRLWGQAGSDPREAGHRSIDAADGRGLER